MLRTRVLNRRERRRLINATRTTLEVAIDQNKINDVDRENVKRILRRPMMLRRLADAIESDSEFDEILEATESPVLDNLFKLIDGLLERLPLILSAIIRILALFP